MSFEESIKQIYDWCFAVEGPGWHEGKLTTTVDTKTSIRFFIVRPKVTCMIHYIKMEACLHSVFTFVKRKNRLSQNTCPHLMFRKEKTYLKYLLSEKASISVLSFIVLNGVPYAKSKEPIIWNREHASNVEVNNNLRPEFYYCFSVVSDPLHTKNNG